MKRLGRVVARNHRAITLQLIKAEKCANCPANCNEPLVDLFALRKNHFTLDKNASQYKVVDKNDLFHKPKLLDQLVSININNQDLMKSSALLYLVPLMIVLLMLSAGHFLGQLNQWSADLSAAIGFVLGLIIVFFMSQSDSLIKPLKFRPKVTIL